MTTTVLTDEQIAQALNLSGATDYADVPLSYDLEIARAIEQAVLQSPEVQALRKDAEAFRLMVSKRLTVSVRELGHEVEVFYLNDCLAWPACDPNADDDTRAEVARSAIATAVAAMEKQL